MALVEHFKKHNKAYSLGFLAVVAACVGMLYMQVDDFDIVTQETIVNAGMVKRPAKSEVATPSAIGTGFQMGQNSEGKIEYKNPITGSVFAMGPNAKASKLIEEKTLSSWNIPTDPAKPDVAYLSYTGKYSGVEPNIKSENSIYSYNLKTDGLVGLYNESESRNLKTVGIEGNKLILMFEPIDYSPGCASAWNSSLTYGFLNVNNTTAGIQPYQLPQSKIDEGMAEMKQCQADWEKDMGAESAQLTLSTFKGDGFSFQYPNTLVADKKGLWTAEGLKLHNETTTPCDTCHLPKVEVKSATIDKTLAEHILTDFDLPGSDLSVLKDAGFPAQTLKLGDNEFTRVNLNDQFDVTGYYARKGNRIVSLKTHFSENDNQALKDMLATLKFE